MPIFKSTPARMTEMGVGASTCASGARCGREHRDLDGEPDESANPGHLHERQPEHQRHVDVAAGAPHAAIFAMLKVCCPVAASTGPCSRAR